jgi:hypothetical protein
MRRTRNEGVTLYVRCLRRAPQLLEKRKEQREATENATGDDMPVTPDSKAGDVDEDPGRTPKQCEKRRTMSRNGRFSGNRCSANE